MVEAHAAAAAVARGRGSSWEWAGSEGGAHWRRRFRFRFRSRSSPSSFLLLLLLGSLDSQFLRSRCLRRRSRQKKEEALPPLPREQQQQQRRRPGEAPRPSVWEAFDRFFFNQTNNSSRRVSGRAREKSLFFISKPKKTGSKELALFFQGAARLARSQSLSACSVPFSPHDEQRRSSRGCVGSPPCFSIGDDGCRRTSIVVVALRCRLAVARPR